MNYPVLKLNNVNIERVSQFNFLGVVMNSTLKWDKHIAHISLKISKATGVIFRLRRIYPREILLYCIIVLHNTLILPHLSYCILVWGSKIKNNHLLLLLQTKAVRSIANKDYIAHSEPLCKSLNILKILDIFTCSLWKFYYKLLKNQLPTYFDVMIPMLPNICNIYNIRHPTFHLPLVKHDLQQSNF